MPGSRPSPVTKASANPRAASSESAEDVYPVGQPGQNAPEAGATSGRSRQGPNLNTAVAALVAVIGFLIGSRPIGDNSFLTHLATGRLIWLNGSVPTTDAFSATARGRAVTVQSWLADWIYAAAEATVGDWSIRLMNGVLAAVLAMICWALTKPANALVSRLALTAPAVIIGMVMWSPRPLLFGLIGLGLVLLALDGRISAWVMVPVMWIWVQTHGSFPMALGLSTLVLIGCVLDRVPGWRLKSSVEARTFVACGLGTALGAINPLGIKLLVFPIGLLTRSQNLEGVMEWGPPSFKRISDWALVALCFAVVVSIRAGARWRAMLPAAVLTIMALTALRNVPLAGLVLVWAAAPTFGWDKFSIRGSDRGLTPAVLLAASLAIGAVTVAEVTGSPALKLDGYPTSEVDWLEDHDLVANPDVNLIHRDFVGNYLEFRYGTRASAFVDDRFDFYPSDVLTDALSLTRGGDFGEILDRREADIVLWQAESGFAAWLDASSDWDVIDRPEPLGAAETDETQWVIACRSRLSDGLCGP